MYNKDIEILDKLALENYIYSRKIMYKDYGVSKNKNLIQKIREKRILKKDYNSVQVQFDKLMDNFAQDFDSFKITNEQFEMLSNLNPSSCIALKSELHFKNINLQNVKLHKHKIDHLFSDIDFTPVFNYLEELLLKYPSLSDIEKSKKVTQIEYLYQLSVALTGTYSSEKAIAEQKNNLFIYPISKVSSKLKNNKSDFENTKKEISNLFKQDLCGKNIFNLLNNLYEFDLEIYRIFNYINYKNYYSLLPAIERLQNILQEDSINENVITELKSLENTSLNTIIKYVRDI